MAADLAEFFQGTDEDPADVQRALERALARARSAHPEITVEDHAFAQHLARHAGQPERVADAVDGMHVEDLYLAVACALGDRFGLACFERQFLSQVPLFVAHLRLGREAIEELLQSVRERLLAPRAGGPRILAYSGRGPLGGWLRVTSVRLALTSIARRAPDASSGDEPLAAAAAEGDPELLLARLHAGRAFKTAFEASIEDIDAEERTVLRMHFVDGLTIDQIAAAYGLHRSTAARRLAAGKEKVAALTRRRLRETLHLPAADLDSVLRLVDSQMDLSLARILRDPPAS